MSLLTPEGKKLNVAEMYLIFDSGNFLRDLMGGKSSQSHKGTFDFKILFAMLNCANRWRSRSIEIRRLSSSMRNKRIQVLAN